MKPEETDAEYLASCRSFARTLIGVAALMISTAILAAAMWWRP